MVSDYNRRRALRKAVRIAVLAILLLAGSVGATVSPTPIITSITPTSGVAGMAITINGQNFGTNPGTVLFGDTPANLQHPNGYFKWSDTQIVAQAPIGIGTVQVKIKTLNEKVSNDVPFTYLDVPIVSQWRWPRDKYKSITNWGYGEYVTKEMINEPNKPDPGDHTGIDIYEERYGIESSVFAAADGIVVAKCPDGKECMGFSKHSTSIHNNGLYSVVLIAHRIPPDGTLVYSMYADMADDLGSTPEPGERVYMGKTIIGQTGRDIQYLDEDGKIKLRHITHVHFEIKTKPVLYNPDWPAHNVFWGYTHNKESPDNYGYNNPKQFINMPQPTAPILIPAKDVTIPLTLSWEPVNEGESETTYRIQVSRTSDFKDIEVEKPDIKTTSVVVSELKPNTQYWWRADAKNAGGSGYWSKVGSFTTGNKIPSFSASGKINGVFALGISGVTMTFTKVSGGGTLPNSVQTSKDGSWFQSDFRSDTSYRVTPYKFGYIFTPSSLDFNSANTNLDFTEFTTGTVDESPKQTDGWRISTIINGILRKAIEVFNEYIRIPEAHSAPPTPVVTYTPTITPTPIKTPSSYSGSTLTNSIGIEFVLIPAGEFDMGSPWNEEGRDDSEGPVHHVKISNTFYMGKYEVTQKQWRDVMGSSPSNFKGDNLPVEQVSWNDVQEFIRKLNGKEGTNKYRLPSEAEWEYAVRSGTTTKYSFGDDESLGDYAWSDNSGSKTHDVGQKKPNPWGLFDMHGNVWEWVQDNWHDNYNDAPTDGSSWERKGSDRVNRGGGWYYNTGGCRSASRGFNGQDTRSNALGFRLLRVS